MNWLSNITVRAKLGLLLGIFSLGIAGVSLMGLLSLRSAVDTSQDLIAREVKSVQMLSDIRAAVGNMRRYEKDLFLNLADEELLVRYAGAWQAQVLIAQTQMAGLKPLLAPDEQLAIQAMSAGLVGYAKVVASIKVGIERGEVNDPWAANKLMEPSKADVRAADAALNQIGQSVEARVRSAVDELAGVQRQALVRMLVAVTAILLSALGLGALIAQRITRPLQQAANAVERVAQGDLSQAVMGQGRDETARVLNGIDQMQTALIGMVHNMRQGVLSITGASSEIASGNGDLSRRTEQSAASLEETAASMDELNTAVHHSAQAAVQADQFASLAAAVAARGGQAVSDVVQTMQEINLSSQRINEIIGVIDTIAFQTNILALNAAVEAARAGEEGRGFAVVAAEVRQLAQRSAQAAKEIKGLIDTSVDKVAIGSRQVATAGATMGEIVSSVNQVSGIIAQISAAASEQSSGIGQIHTAINQLDQMTQQNAALVEQSAAAAQSLNDQASRLGTAVAVFKLPA